MDEELSAVPKPLVLLVEKGDRQWLLPILKDPIGIGRSANNHVSDSDPKLAPRHLRLIPMGEELWAKDMGSPEGFLLNGRLVREGRLSPGDEIAIGGLKAVVLIEERPTIHPAPEPVLLPETLEPAFRPARHEPRRAVTRKSVGLRIFLGLILVLTLVALGLVVGEQMAERQRLRERERCEEVLLRAKLHLKQGRFEESRATLAELPRQDPNWDAQARAIEKEIARQFDERARIAERAAGDEFMDRFLQPLFSSALLQSDVRWEFIAWRRCEEFLGKFPKHPLVSLVQARRNRFAAGAKEPPPPKIEEVELEVQDLLDSKAPHFGMARERVISFIRANTGTAEDLRARAMLRQVDARAEAYLPKALAEALSTWKAGDRQAALRTLDRLAKEIGQEDLVRKVEEARLTLESGGNH